jgi:uncharacterized protein
VIPTASLAARNRLAELILHALSDARARADLDRLASAGSPPEGWLPVDADAEQGAMLAARARRASEALRDQAVLSGDRSLDEALRAAAVLFDAGLYFEVHELLEPCWLTASGEHRPGLQGLIQIAVGYQHLANGNLAGARALLADGAARLAPRGIPGIDVRKFVAGVRATVDGFDAFDWSDVPNFPRATRPGGHDAKEA